MAYALNSIWIKIWVLGRRTEGIINPGETTSQCSLQIRSILLTSLTVNSYNIQGSTCVFFKILTITHYMPRSILLSQSRCGPTAAAAAKSLQSCPTLCNPVDGSPPGSAVPGILQARTPEWVAVSFSNAWKWKVKVKSLSQVWLLVTPQTAVYQAPLSMGVSRQEYWSGVPLPSLVDQLLFLINRIYCHHGLPLWFSW